VFHRPRPGVPGRRGVRGVGGATGVIRRSLAGASCARSTSRAALLASTPDLRRWASRVDTYKRAKQVM